MARMDSGYRRQAASRNEVIVGLAQGGGSPVLCTAKRRLEERMTKAGTGCARSLFGSMSPRLVARFH